MSNIDGEVGFMDLLAVTARAALRETAEALRPQGLTPAQYALLDLIDRDGPQYPTLLARRLDIETSTIASILKRAERDGLICRVRDPRDARGVIVEITDDGRGLLPAARKAVATTELRALRTLTEEEIRRSRKLLKQVLVNLKT